MYCKEISLQDVKGKLREELSDETCKDIEDFLLPKFVTELPQGRRKWRIVQDGHGRWREINVGAKHEKHDVTNKYLPKTPASNKLLRSNNILINGEKSTSKLQQSGRTSRQDLNYKTLSTNTRANIFPGVGKYNWFSQSNNVYTESALKLRDMAGRDLQGGFYGITRDALGAWNEANVHHERMKKAWDVYLESLAKTGGEPDDNTKLKTQEIANKTKKSKKVKKPIRKKTEKGTIEYIQTDKFESKDQPPTIPDKLDSKDQPPTIPPQQTVFEKDDDFWNFYEQPFQQS